MVPLSPRLLALSCAAGECHHPGTPPPLSAFWQGKEETQGLGHLPQEEPIPVMENTVKTTAILLPNILHPALA